METALPKSAYIGTAMSMVRGTVLSLLNGIVTAVVITLTVAWITDGFWLTRYPEALITLALCIAAPTFVFGLVSVDFQAQAALLFLGNDTNKVLKNGLQWVFPLIEEALQTPGPEQRFMVEVPPSEPEAMDHIRVLIGHKKPAMLVVRVFHPGRYAALVRQHQLYVENLFTNSARIFVNQLKRAKGIMQENGLFEDWIEFLPKPEDDDKSLAAFMHRRNLLPLEARLRKATFTDEDDGEDQEKEYPLFDPTDGVETLMNHAGRFRREVALGGMIMDNLVLPSLDPPDEIAAAAELKAVQREQNKRTRLWAETFTDVTENMRDRLGVTGNDAGDRVERQEKKPVTRSVEEKIVGVTEATQGVVERIAGGILGTRMKVTPPPSQTSSKVDSGKGDQQ